jgi:hypothetical protein
MGDLLVIPLWDLFQKGIIILGVLAILDFGLMYRTRARYFSLHGLWNVIITILILPDMYKTLIDPQHALTPGSDFNRWPTIMVTMLHFWHCIAYNGLSVDDYIHHFVFAISLGIINLIWDWGYSTNFMIFFICGLPGGLDYLMLSAVKHGYIKKISEKRINKTLNVWCRGPGCIAAACLIWINWMAGETGHIPTMIKIITILLAIINGQYYSRRVVESCVLHEDKLSRDLNRDLNLTRSASMEKLLCDNCQKSV